MRSSISSSELSETATSGLIPILLLFLRCAWLPALAFILMTALVHILLTDAGGHPPITTYPIENVILSGQIERARTIKNADLLIIGDSSALMGIDAVMLGRILSGKRVESLASIGLVGPRGYAKFLNIYRQSHGGTLPVVVVLMHPSTLTLNERDFKKNNFEKPFLDKTIPLLSARGIRDNIFYNGIKKILIFPLPGSYGRYYGFENKLRKSLLLHNGSLVDPNVFQPGDSTNCYKYLLSDAMKKRMPALRKELKRPKTGAVYWGITPMPKSHGCEETSKQVEAIAASVEALMGQPAGNTLKLPDFLNDDLFANGTHLNEEGRNVYTKTLAKALMNLKDPDYFHQQY